MFCKSLSIFVIFAIFTVQCSKQKSNNNVKQTVNILGVGHFPSQSHHILLSTLLKELARQGHNVTVVSSFPLDEKVPNYTDIVLKGIVEKREERMQEHTKGDKFSLKRGLQIWKSLSTLIPTMGNTLLNQDSMQNLIKSDSKFDLIILAYPLSEHLLALSHRFNAPIILFQPSGTSSFLNGLTGNIGPYSYVPSWFLGFTENMTFFQRVINTLVSLVVEITYNLIIVPQFQELSHKYFPDAPPLEQLYNNISLVLVNSHFSTESPRPYTPNMIQIGGFHVEETEPLPKDLQKYLDDAKEGVIYFSFGTNIKPSQLYEEKLNIIIKCFSKIKQKVIWTFDGNLQDLPKNIKIEKWLPQRGILAHPNVKAFITHGGKGSIVEATKNGVPMLAMPFFGDQLQNVADAVKNKYAVSMVFQEITEESFSKALNEILTNPIYKENIKLKSSLLNAQPIKPMEKALYWIEHVIQHKGADHLKPASLKLNIFQQLCIDVIAFLIGVLLAGIFVIYLSIKGVCKLCRRRKNQEKVKTS